MKRSTTWALVLLVLAVAAGAAWLALREDRRGAMDGPPLIDEAVGERSDARVARPAREDDRTGAAAEPALPSAGSATPEVRTALLRGRVLDASGDPVPGVAIGLHGQERELARSWADGGFELHLEHGVSGRLSSVDPRWITLRASAADASRTTVAEHVVVVAPAIRIQGWVVDAELHGIADVRLEIAVPREALARFPFPLDTAFAVEDVRRTDGHGAFDESRIPAVAGALLAVSHGDLQRRVELPTSDALGWLIELRGPDDTAPHLVGRVLLADGAPATAAEVALGRFATRTDELGRFRLDFTEVEADAALLAVQVGHQPAVVPGFGASLAAPAADPAPVVLVLGPPPLSASGRVVRHGGEPCANWRVELVDGTSWNPWIVPPQWTEELASGGRASTFTDAQGRFELTGLSERDYRIQAWSATTLEMVESEPLRAGAQDVTLVVSNDALFARLRGRVLTTRGEPAAGVSVVSALVVASTPRGTDSRDGPASITDERGWFELERVPRVGGRLDLSGPTILPARQVLDAHDGLAPLEIVVAERCWFRVAWPNSPDAPDGLRALDATGKRVDVFALSGESWRASTYQALTGGNSGVLSLGPGRYTLVLLRGREEVARTEVVLEPGEPGAVRSIER